MSLLEVELNVYVLNYELWIVNFNRHLMVWEMYETWWIMFINLKLKLYRNIYIASLPCSLFMFAYLSMMIMFYTGEDEVIGNKVPQWTTRGWDNFHLNVL